MDQANSIIKPLIIDLSRFSNWLKAKGELLSLISKSHSFWGDTPLTLRFSDFHFSQEEVESLKNILEESNLCVYSIQTNSKISAKLISDAGFLAESIPIIRPRNQPSIRLIKESSNIPAQQTYQQIQPEIQEPSPKLSTVSPLKIDFSTKQQTQQQEKRPILETVLPSNSYIKNTAFVGMHEIVALRAGALVSYDGNILIMGDVNPGCQIKATGSVIVQGKLCGSVHAGFGIEDDAKLETIVVRALKMGEPLQISIGEYSACSSNESNIYSKQKIYPETARVIDGRIWRVSDFE
ncbi:MAG: septum site-determining protein MinC [Candidatus Caenarcaniphilales bacterium]|nr:septum site-determining protein MinC [Candidatus Caenarcaniphilales bacterium]